MNRAIFVCISILALIQLANANDIGCPFSEHANKPVAEVSNRENEIADPETTTPHGCTCTSLCGTSIGAGYYGYDWCYTTDQCDNYAFYYGYWDKCEYKNSAKPNYSDLSWERKQKQMWENIVSDNTSGPSNSPFSLLHRSVQTTFKNEWDVMPAGRKKFIHPTGVVCPFVINIKNSPFTGILQSGESHGLIRLGSALSPNLKKGIIPGAAIKFFRSGKHSANVVMLNKLAVIADYNFFSVPLANHVPDAIPLKLIPVALKFCQAQSCPTKVGLSDVCTYDQNGNKSDNVKFPFKVTLVPTGGITFREELSEDSKFMEQFKDLSVGTTLYYLRGHQGPDDTDGLLLGNVVTTDKCVTSLYGDTKLFFKHQYINEDKELMPEWADDYDKECTNYCTIIG